MATLKWTKRSEHERVAFHEDHDGSLLTFEIKPDFPFGLVLAVSDVTGNLVYMRGGIHFAPVAMLHAKLWLEKRLRQAEIELRLMRSRHKVGLM